MGPKNTVKLVLICPECGFMYWEQDDDGLWKCASCGQLVYPKGMCTEVVGNENND